LRSPGCHERTHDANEPAEPSALGGGLFVRGRGHDANELAEPSALGGGLFVRGRGAPAFRGQSEAAAARSES